MSETHATTEPGPPPELNTADVSEFFGWLHSLGPARASAILAVAAALGSAAALAGAEGKLPPQPPEEPDDINGGAVLGVPVSSSI